MTPTLQLSNTENDNLTRDEQEFYIVLQKLWDKFVQRNRLRHGVWRRSGLRGQTHEIFAKAERAYVQTHVAEEIPDRDHFEDIVIYAIFALILMNESENKVPSLASDLMTREDRKTMLLFGQWPYE